MDTSSEEPQSGFLSSLSNLSLPSLPSFDLEETSIGTIIGAVTSTVAGYLAFRYFYIKLKRRFLRQPPGPVGLPFIGSFLPFSKSQIDFIATLKKYGPITQFNLFLKPMIVVLDTDMAATLLKEITYKQPISDTFMAERGKYRPISLIFMPNNTKWHKMRKMTHSSLLVFLDSKALGASVKRAMESEFFPTLDEFAKNGKIWRPKNDIASVKFNNMFQVLYGRRLSKKNKEYQRYVELFNLLLPAARFETFAGIAGSTNGRLGEYLWTFAKDLWMELKDIEHKWFLEATGYKIDTMKGTLEEKGEKYIAKGTNEINCAKLFIKQYYKDDNNFMSVSDLFMNVELLFGASVDTTTNSAEYMIALLGCNPEIQEKVCSELKEVMERNNLTEFSLKILHELHYFRAFIWEGFRISSVGFAIVRATQDKPMKVDQYVIPKNTAILFDIQTINTNSKNWPNEGKIHLKNWLNDDNKFVPNKKFYGFGKGRRDCPGKTVAQRSIYAFFGHVLPRYRFVLSDPNYKWEQLATNVLSLIESPPIKVYKR